LIDLTGAYEFNSIRNAKPNKAGLIQRAVLPLGDLVIFPNMITPISIEAKPAFQAAETAIARHQTIIGVAQRKPEIRNPKSNDLYTIGTEVAIGGFFATPDDPASVLGQGRRRVEVVEVVQSKPYMVVKARPLPESSEPTSKTAGIAKAVLDLLKRYVELSEDIPDDVIDYVLALDDPGQLADVITSTLNIPLAERQRVLELQDVDERLQYVARLLGHELSIVEVREEINSQIQQEMARGQREMYLREQMRVIQSELGEEDVFQQEVNDLRKQIDNAGLPDEVHEKALKELARLEMMPPMAPEVGIIHTYIDWLVSLPWVKKSEDNLDIAHAQKVLDDAHYGLTKVKDRILEHIAVRKLAAEKMKSPILCFVGPPGVGKTSMGKSIAQALGREFVRVSLGGVRDEAEIRGHRRTYIGALPGRILQTMRRAGTINPVFMLDEIDKLGVDFRGDPAAALLEALDPEQNNAYLDHYLDVTYDLSKVLFITTANDLSPLPEALEDRLEVIEFTGYIEEEKLEISRRFLIPKQFEANGLTDVKVSFETAALGTIIREYTYESGVRNLEREIANVCRKVARMVAEGKPYPTRIAAKQVEKYLGPPGYIAPHPNDKDRVGIVTGLVYTPAGGDIQTIEVSLVPGKGNLTMTGQLGDVLQESAQTAFSYMRSRAVDFNIPFDDFENYDVHVHMPEGSVPKEGSSAGITLATGIISVFTERKVRCDYAMTGEITLYGNILPIGGVKEKVLAARRARIKNVILPAENKKDLVDIPAKALRDMNIIFVDTMQQVLDLVLLEAPPKRQRDSKARPLNSDSQEHKRKGNKAKTS
jgi:ATP-dependent Lon protease